MYSSNNSPRVVAQGLPSIKLTFFDDTAAEAPKRWLLKGLLAIGETSSWIALPGQGKSALQTEIAVHCAAKRDWRGCVAKERCGVLILAFERAAQYRRRLKAYQIRDGLTDLPIAIGTSVVNLIDPGCVAQIVNAVRDVERHFGCDVGLIVIDTFSKGIAVGGGDENSARDQNRVAANLAEVHAQLNVHIALVGHTGKDENKGARGSNAHLADVDVMVTITGDKAAKTAAITKANDQTAREIAHFIIDAFTIGTDEDGDPITTGIVSAEEIASSLDTQGVRNRQPSSKAIKCRDAIKHVIEQGQITLLTNGTAAASAADWKKECDSRGLINLDRADSARAEFSKLKGELVEHGLIRQHGNLFFIL